MNNTEDRAYILIDKYQSGQASSEEVMQLQNWRNSSEKNNNLYNELSFLLKLINQLGEWKQFDRQQAWDKLQLRMSAKRLRIVRQLMAAAAILLFVLAATFWNFNKVSDFSGEQFLSGIDHRYSILDDGSEVFFVNNSKVFTSNFSKTNRFLRTEGSYFVNVAHDKAAPFKIETAKVSIEVLGTSFKVEEDEHSTVIKVRDGKVLITNYDGTVFTIKEGEQFTLSDKSVTIGKVAGNEWGLMNVSYEDASLFTLLNDLSDQYGNIEFSPGAVGPDCKITTKIENSTIIEILEELDLLFDVEYSYEKGKLSIKKISC